MGSGSIGQTFLSLELDGMCGQLRTSADLHPGKISLIRGLVDPRAGWMLLKEKCLRPLLGSKL